MENTRPPLSEIEIEKILTQPELKLADALAKAQLEIKAPIKNRHVNFTDKNGRTIKYSYADLADVIEALKPLSKNGIAIIHQMEYSAKGTYGLKTSLLHSSGESFSTWYPLPDPATTTIRAQDFGSALTYARRYSVSALTGIASDEDDDGAQAPPIEPKAKPKQTPAPVRNVAQPLPKPQPKPLPTVPPSNPEYFDEIDMLPEPPPEYDGQKGFDDLGGDEPGLTLLQQFYSLVDVKGIPEAEAKNIIKMVCGGKLIKSTAMSEQQLKDAIGFINLAK